MSQTCDNISNINKNESEKKGSRGVRKRQGTWELGLEKEQSCNICMPHSPGYL